MESFVSYFIDVLCKFEVLAVFIRFCVETINNEANDLLIQESVLFASKCERYDESRPSKNGSVYKCITCETIFRHFCL